MQGNIKKTSLTDEILTALASIRFGSIEIYVQDGVVTQLTVRNIKKTKFDLGKNSKNKKNL